MNTKDNAAGAAVPRYRPIEILCGRLDYYTTVHTTQCPSWKAPAGAKLLETCNCVIRQAVNEIDAMQVRAADHDAAFRQAQDKLDAVREVHETQLAHIERLGTELTAAHGRIAALEAELAIYKPAARTETGGTFHESR